MKKFFLFSVVMIAFTTISLAQNKSGTAFHLGVKAGANLGKIDGSSFKDEFNLGYHLGGFAVIDFSKVVGIQPEILFSQINTTVTDEPLSGLRPGEKIKLRYLSIPVLLRINASDLITFHVGPEFSILTDNHKTTLENAGDAFKDGDFALVAGAQVNLGSFNVYGRYNIGLNKINQIDDRNTWKHQVIQVGLGLRLL